MCQTVNPICVIQKPHDRLADCGFIRSWDHYPSAGSLTKSHGETDTKTKMQRSRAVFHLVLHRWKWLAGSDISYRVYCRYQESTVQLQRIDTVVPPANILSWENVTHLRWGSLFASNQKETPIDNLRCCLQFRKYCLPWVGQDRRPGDG